MKVIEVPASFDLRDLRPVERPELPDPGPGQVLIRMNTVSLNFRDLLVAQGHDPATRPEGHIDQECFNRAFPESPFWS